MRVTRYFTTEISVLCYLALLKLLIHMLTNGQYGFHRDELLYLAQGEHLSWGYLEIPPFLAALGNFSRLLLGDSLTAVRFLPAIAGAAMVFMTGLMARELGGGRFAQFLSAIAMIASPLFLGAGNLFQPVAFDQLFWVVGTYFLILFIRRQDPRLWLILGLIIGIGLLNKYTMLLFGFGLLVGLLLTDSRSVMLTKWPWLAALMAAVIFSPNIIWQIQHGWPLVAHLSALAESQLAHISPIDFLLGQLWMHAFTIPVWLTGLVYAFLPGEGKPYRPLGWIYVVNLLVLLFLSGKIYYLGPAYPALFALGAFAIERFISTREWHIAKVALPVVIVALNLPAVPYALPVLSITKFEAYAHYVATRLGFSSPLRWETGQIERITQDYADMFGWEEQAATVSRIYHSLPPDERSQCTIWGGNYGEAGAIDLFGEKYGLPKAICHNSSYYLWGPGEASSEVGIHIGYDWDAFQDLFHESQLVAVITHEWARENNVPVYVFRGAKIPFSEMWLLFEGHQF